MLGCNGIAQSLVTRALSVTKEVREKLYSACETPTRAWRVEEGLSQWVLALNTDIKSWMYAHDLPVSQRLRNVEEGLHIARALNDAYDGRWETFRAVIEKYTDKMPKGVTGLQFNVKSTGITLWQERGLARTVKDKKLALRINADAQLWLMKVDTSNGFAGELQAMLPKRKLMQRYGCRFKIGIHICLKGCKYQEYINALLVCATLYRLLDILPKWLPVESIVAELYFSPELMKVTVIDGLSVKITFFDMCFLMHFIGLNCLGFSARIKDYAAASLLGNQLIVGSWVANMDIGNWATYFTRHEVGYAEILEYKPKEAIYWMDQSQLLGPAKANIYTDSTPAGWWCVPWVIAGVPGLRVRKGVTDVVHVALYSVTLEELEELHKTIMSNHDVAPKEVKSLLGFIRDFQNSDKQIIAVDGNTSSRALVYHLARLAGRASDRISLSCTNELMNNDKYLIYIDNPILDTVAARLSATLH